MKKTVLINFLLCLSTGLLSQGQSFETDYELSVCKGNMPIDFSTDILEKTIKDVEKDNFDLSTAKKKKFYENSNYYIYNFLNGGKVLFGDELSLYVNKVAQTLFEKSGNTAIQDKFKFYVLKSNVVNAVCMADGSIFITVGLLSQIESEAQLAFVLAHEIAHYTLQHGIKTYSNNEKLKTQYNRSKIEYDDAISDLSEHSKDQELESDRVGFEMFIKAGYHMDEAMKMLLVLQYSHLPFDELEFENTFFNRDRYTIPSNYFETEELTDNIEDNSDIDDSYSTHPNIKTRIENLEIEFTNNRNGMKGVKSYEAESEFSYIQTKARFETQYLNLIQRKFIKTIYESFLLKKKFPNNKFLDECIAKALYAISKNKTNGNVSYNSNTEGNSLELFNLFEEKMDKKEVNILALKMLLEVDSDKLKPYILDLLIDLTNEHGMSYDSFYYNEKQVVVDTTKVKNDSIVEEVIVKEITQFKLLDSAEYLALTKVGKIKYNRAKKRHFALLADTISTQIKEVDVPVKSNYYKTAFFDKGNDKKFKELFNEANEMESPNYFEDLSYSEQANLKREREKRARSSKSVKVDSIIILNTNYEIYKRNGDFDTRNSFKLENIMSQKLNEEFANSDVAFLDLTTTTLNNQSIDIVNANFIIKEWKNEMNASYDNKMLPLTQDRMNGVVKSLGYKNVMIMGVYNEFNPIIFNQMILARWLPLISIIIAPGVWPLHIVRFNKFNTTKYAYVMDENGYNILYRKFESNKNVNVKQDEIFIEYIINQLNPEK